MHPRTAIRYALKDLLATLPSALPVYISRVRDMPKGVTEAVLVYLPSESFSLPTGAGEDRPSRPLQRSMTVEILVMTSASGEGDKSADRADEVCREIELLINAGATDLTPLSADQAFSEGVEMKCMTTITYSVDFFDTMEA